MTPTEPTMDLNFHLAKPPSIERLKKSAAVVKKNATHRMLWQEVYLQMTALHHLLSSFFFNSSKTLVGGLEHQFYFMYIYI